MKKIKVGIVGTGLWGENHACVFSKLATVDIIAVCDVNPSKAQKMADKYNINHVFSDYKHMLAIDELDAISVATPDFAHTQIIIDGVQAHKHVLSEKPLATTVEQAEKVKEACDKSPAIFMIDFPNRINPSIFAAAEAIKSNNFGHIIHGHAKLSNTTAVPLEMLSWSSRSSALWFLGSHLIDALRFILQDEIVRVFAMSHHGVLKNKGVDTADVHLSMLEFEKGTIMTIENSWILSPDNPNIFDFDFSFVGDKGQIQLSPSHNGAYRHMNGGGLKYKDLFGITPASGNRIGGFVQEAIARFIDSITMGTPVLADVDDGLVVTKILAAIEQSVRTGVPVDVR